MTNKSMYFTRTEKDAGDVLDKEAKAYAAKHNVSYARALEKTMKDNPLLSKQHVNATVE